VGQKGIRLHFVTPGKPVENAYIKSFTGKFRDEYLNESWFLGLDDARTKIAAHRTDYNEVRPHSSLDNMTPVEFTHSFSGLARSAV
jgi:putative transposase